MRSKLGFSSSNAKQYAVCAKTLLRRVWSGLCAAAGLAPLLLRVPPQRIAFQAALGMKKPAK